MKLPIGATLSATCGIALLLSLGGWQVQRLHWKNGIIERLERQYTVATGGDTVSQDTDTLPARLAALSGEADPLAYLSVGGALDAEQGGILLGPRVLDGRAGYELIAPLSVADGDVLLVNLGWVPDVWKDTLAARLSTLPRDVTVSGVVRRPDWTFMTSRNSPANDLWFRADTTQIATAKHLGATYPVVLYADRMQPPLEDVSMHEAHWLPRNKHKQYALFWFAMAGALACVYALYVRALNRSR